MVSTRIVFDSIKSLHNLYQRKLVRRLLFGLTILFVLSIFLSILYSNWSLLINYQWQINVWALAATFVIYTLGLLSVTFGWFLLMHSLIPKGGFWEHFRIYVLANLAKRIPGSLWHIAGRLVMYKHIGISRSIVAIGSGIEAILMVISAIISYLLALNFSSGHRHFEWWLAAILVVGLLVIHPGVISFLLGRLKGRSYAVRPRYKDLAAWLFFYVIAWSMGGVFLFGLINTLTPLPLAKLPDVIAAWTLAGVLSSLIFFSPSGLGVQEITIVVLVGQLIPQPVAVIVAILLRGLLMVCQLISVAVIIILSKWGFWAEIRLIPPKDY